MHHIHPYFHDDQPVRLDEMTYKDLIADITGNNVPGAIVHNLPHRDWMPLLREIRYRQRRGNIMQFYAPNKMNGWFCYIQMMQFWDMVNDKELNAVEAARLLLWGGDLRLDCNCPSQLFHGYRYILTQLDASIREENRYPSIKNPSLLGVCCKHLRKSLKSFPFFLGTIAKEIKIERQKLL